MIHLWFICVQTRFDVSGRRGEASDRDSAKSINETPRSLARSKEQTCRLDEEVSRQDEVARAMVTANSTIGSIGLKEQHEVSVESSRVALLTGNTTTSLSVTRSVLSRTLF